VPRLLVPEVEIHGQLAVSDADDIGTTNAIVYTTILPNNIRDNAAPITDQRPAGLHPPSLGTISILRADVQPRRTPTTATAPERRLRLGLVPATIRRW